MQLATKNPFAALPLDIFRSVRNRENSETLSTVDKKLYELCVNVTQSIRLCPPDPYQDKYPDSILVDLIKRYPLIKRISIGKKHTGFEKTQEKHLSTLISYLNVHPLIHIKTLIIREIEGSKELNRTLMGSLSHSGLESITIKVLYEESVLTGLEIQPILEKAFNLRVFKLNCHAAKHPSIALTFAKQTQLSSAQFIEFCEPMDTLKSVKSCPKLKSLRLTNAHDSTQIKQLLSSKASRTLKRLSLPGLIIDSDAELDAITKMHPNLEHLNITLGNVTEKGFQMIGKNCPHLSLVIFSYPNATDQGLEKFTRKLPLLKELTLIRSCNITEKGVAAIAQNCPGLRLNVPYQRS